jgi:hypothetical protein
LDCVVYNPRRASFDINDPKQSEIQIRWEHKYLNLANIVIFYFSSETMCPITLFELGSRLMSNTYNTHQSIYIYCEPEYQRKFDVEFQTKLAKDNFLSKFASNCDFNLNYDVDCFDNYDKFIVKLRTRIVQ